MSELSRGSPLAALTQEPAGNALPDLSGLGASPLIRARALLIDMLEVISLWLGDYTKE